MAEHLTSAGPSGGDVSAHEASEGMLTRPLWERVARWRVEGSIVLTALLLVGFALLVVPPLLVLLRTSVGQVGIDGVVRVLAMGVEAKLGADWRAVS